VKQIFFILMMCLVPLEQMAQQFPADQWHQGEAILKDQTVVSGMISYDLEKEAIIVNVGERMETYSAHLVLQFSIIQNSDERLRRFYSLPYLSQNGYKTIPRFFELIVEGKMTLLAREYIDQISTGGNNRSRYNRYNNNPMNAPMNNQTYTRRFLSYKMFFLDHKGKLTDYSGRKKDIYNVLTEETHELKKYVKTNRLKIDNLKDVAILVTHYNTLI